MPMSVHLLILMQLERWVEIISTFHLTHTKLLWYWIPSKLKRPRWWIKTANMRIYTDSTMNCYKKSECCNFLCCICICLYQYPIRLHYKTNIFWGFVLWQSMWHWTFKYRYSKYNDTKYTSKIDDDHVLSRPKRLQKCL